MWRITLSGCRKHMLAVPILAFYPKWNFRAPKPLDCKSSLHEGVNSAPPTALSDDVSSKLAQYTQGDIAVVSMIGSMNPVTRAHIRCLVEARDIMLNENNESRPPDLQKFKDCIGFVHLNPDAHLARKFRNNDFYGLEVREELVRLAIKDEGLDWLQVGKLAYKYDDEVGLDRAVSVALEDLNERHKDLKFVEYDVNGADDVVNNNKVAWAGKKHRFRKMNVRNGKEAPACFVTFLRDKHDNIGLMQHIQDAGFDPPNKYCIVGPEIEDFSSTAVRQALERRDIEGLRVMVHDLVADKLLEPGIVNEHK